MQEGLYESLITDALAQALGTTTSDQANIAPLEPGEQSHVLARHVAEVVQRRLAAITDETERLDVTTAVLQALEPTELVRAPTRQLLSVVDGAGLGTSGRFASRPRTPCGIFRLRNASPPLRLPVFGSLPDR